MSEKTSKDGFSGHLKRCDLDESIYDELDVNYEKMSFKELMEIKKQIEFKISNLSDILKNTFHATMTTNLLTPDRFPRTDIDVIGIRMTRVKIIRLKNDYNRLLNFLSDRLPEFFNQGVRVNDIEPKIRNTEMYETDSEPFARVDQVNAEGPAYASGLRENDLLISFGDINIKTFHNLSQFTDIVSKNEEKSISLNVLRNRKTYTIDLIPSRNWPGKGCLGCYISAL